MQNGQNPTQVNLGIRYDAGVTKIYLGGGVQGFDFTDNNRPFMLFAGIKRPFRAKQPAQSLISTAVVTVQEETDLEFSKVVDFINAMVIYFDNN